MMFRALAPLALLSCAPMVIAAGGSTSSSEGGGLSGGVTTRPATEVKVDAVLAAPRVHSIDQAIKYLIHEAEPAWKSGRAFPRQQIDFAKQSGADLTESSVHKALARELHKVPPIDAYVKWQLLGYIGDFNLDDRDQVERIIESVPELAAAPAVPTVGRPSGGGGRGGVPGYIFTGRQIAYVSDLEPVVGAGGEIGFNPTVSVISEGVLLKADGYVTIYRTEYLPVYRATANRFNFNRKWVNHANQATRRYRDALIDRVPTQGGDRYAARLVDLSQRLQAGDLSYEQTLEKLTNDADGLAGAKDVTRSRLRGLAVTTQSVGKLKKPIITELRVVPEDKRMYVEKHDVQVPSRDVDGLIFRLKQAAR